MLRAALAVYVVGLLTATLAPLSIESLQVFRGADKVAHFVLFGGLSALLYWNLAPSGRANLLTVPGQTAVVAAIVELLQIAVPGRGLETWDLVWGAAGGLLAYVVLARRNLRVRGRRVGRPDEPEPG
jgi:VanZ family protein